MRTQQTGMGPSPVVLNRKGFLKTMVDQKSLYLMALPFIILVFVFSYIPIWGWVTAFQHYRPSRSFFDQEWVGLKYFKDLLSDPRFYLVMKNTLGMSLLGLIFGFTIPIVFAVLLNEVKNGPFKKVVQTVSYLPHFVSWVVVAGLVTSMLSTEGVVNAVLINLGVIDNPILFMANGKGFWALVTAADVWKEVGWNSIIYLAAMSAIDPQLYEAAKVDGAGRIRQIFCITIPGIQSTIIILLILSIGSLISIGFEKQMLLGNPLVLDYSEVLDLYALNYGINAYNFSFGTAVGIFKSVVSVFLLFLSNGIFKKISGESVI